MLAISHGFVVGSDSQPSGRVDGGSSGLTRRIQLQHTTAFVISICGCYSFFTTGMGFIISAGRGILFNDDWAYGYAWVFDTGFGIYFSVIFCS